MSHEAEVEELLDVAAQAIFDRRRQENAAMPCFALCFAALDEVNKRIYRAEALEALRAAAYWMDEHDWDSGFRFKQVIKGVEA